MTGFVESFVTTIADTATRVARKSRGHPSARRLLRVLAGKRNILITTHVFPDPDAIASAHALAHLLRAKLPNAKVTAAAKGTNQCGINAGFSQLAGADVVEWDDTKLADYDAVVLLDAQANFSTSPLPPGKVPTAVIDHHRSRGRRQKVPFSDIRPDVGASASIIFSYLSELKVPIPPQLAAMLLYGIETDLAGVAGSPGELDNMAISNLTLLADTRKLYQMRYTSLPAEFYVNFGRGISEAMYAGKVLGTHLGVVDSPAMPAVVADFLLRFEGIAWVLVAAVHRDRIILSLRTNEPKASAGEMMRRLTRHLGEGGGHRTKAGGFIPLCNRNAQDMDRLRRLLRRRLLKLTGMPRDTEFKRLVDSPPPHPTPLAPAPPEPTVAPDLVSVVES
jgi:nanoRNase/pAp phosphatase (c-di-AMP/oligoRNAs hydrolase)